MKKKEGECIDSGRSNVLQSILNADEFSVSKFGKSCNWIW